MNCFVDATSSVGLSLAARSRPKDWQTLIVASLARAALTPEITIAAYLCSGRCKEMLPGPGTSPGTLRSRRNLGRQLVIRYGSVRIADIDDAFVASAEKELRTWVSGSGDKERLKPTSRARWRRAVSLLRRVAVDGQRALRLDPRVSDMPRGPRMSGGTARLRIAARPDRVRRLLGQCKGKVAAAVVLVYGAGMLPSELLRLRVRSLHLPGLHVDVREANRRGKGPSRRERRVFIPAWGLPYIERAFPDLDKRDGDELLFQCRDNPNRPRSSMTPALKRASERAGLAPALDFEALHRGFVLLARAVVPRAIARGTAGRLQEEKRKEVQAEARRFAEFWRVIDEPSGGVPKHDPPRRAPRRIAPHQRETVPMRERRWAPETTPAPYQGKPVRARPDRPVKAKKRAKPPTPKGFERIDLSKAPPPAREVGAPPRLPLGRPPSPQRVVPTGPVSPLIALAPKKSK